MKKVKKKYDNKFYNNVSFSEIPQIVKNEYKGLIDDRLLKHQTIPLIFVKTSKGHIEFIGGYTELKYFIKSK